jgi:iron complex outermembrane receptor protein
LEINRDLIEKSGERTTADLLRKLPIAGPRGVPTSNNGNTPTAGASSISLRGFDPSDTLTLIDGLRVAPYPVGAGNNSTQTFVDLNSIPQAAIESIEILKDGASSTYGADAVAGVVNISCGATTAAWRRASIMEIRSIKIRANFPRRSFLELAIATLLSPAS